MKETMKKAGFHKTLGFITTVFFPLFTVKGNKFV